MRLLSVLLLIAGAGIGVLYPWVMSNFSGHEIGTYRVYEGGRFRPVTVQLKASDAPIRVLVDLTAKAERVASQQRTVLTLTAASGGRTAIASTLSFNHTDNPRQVSPQLPDKMFRDEAGVIEEVSPGPYVLTVGPGDADGIDMRAVDLVLRAGTGSIDERARPAGYALMGIGLVGLILSLVFGRGGGRPQNPNSQPPPPRWGRSGAPR
ncbi:hypothetical protein EN836_22465 [Mesorhizobium sp. M1C.F.Ca.ET.193.01.1.1]|uniref:hypothetical protein n=1 Tax=unclassified Mesorhizobium TaxID=325217 RepID=UPI000FD33672|nr:MULTISPECIES: hypothetical protein [unclassified Mesorhizobium]TGS95633.1 hypothetical protein EN820_43185 [bacterium M00.F.Ca.ET.177.01.1.1]TGQ51705.1 hypothetical protein EN853_22455 [Mesorhizobium sp. M1C.F.Ca.ET.210.01.1.1]TGQ67940.1 hypothetical protein EN855_022465 [Mesorhizobium sp. M1C.F.Ca.ET.212.01.1.1]TGR03024.1 hypothetical protein EN847_22455 [Mesorhizobium sp. M1C.F.Ca.ET.204.01.1.1]TGR23563.1 hypothetical protein EN839_22455 [Mesorhizobium sp. M1C.F.Ca.ET.196.01.1.1]